MILFERVSSYEKQLTTFFDPTNDGNFPIIRCFSKYFKSRSSCVAGESPVDSSSCNHSFDVGKDEIVICHLFEEVREGKLVIAVPYFASNGIDNSQSG
jgi:hypothetical protein